MEAIEYGAFRYLLKPVRWKRCWRSSHRAVARAQAGARAARGQPDQGAGREADRRSRGPGGALRVGGRQAVGRRAAHRVVVGAQTSSRTRRCCGRTSRRCAARSTSSTPPSGWGGPPSSDASSARTSRRCCAGRAPAGHVFVNLHPADLEDPELYADDGALTPYASQVVLEITERAALDRHPRAERRA